MNNTALAAAITAIAMAELPAINAPLGGGYYDGIIRIDGQLYAQVTAGIEGEVTGVWLNAYDEVPGARSYCDGRANTAAMLEVGSPLAKMVQTLNEQGLNGASDWHIPARDQQELQYRTKKPTAQENYCSFRDGDNPSSVPTGYPYTGESPVQTVAEDFRAGGKHAFSAAWYWSSTQCSADCAWYQDFDDGSQDNFGKEAEGRARVVRLIPIIQ